MIVLTYFLGEEFCAALKIPFPKMKVYERKRKHKKDIGYDGQKYSFKYIETILNKVKFNSASSGLNLQVISSNFHFSFYLEKYQSFFSLLQRVHRLQWITILVIQTHVKVTLEVHFGNILVRYCLVLLDI